MPRYGVFIRLDINADTIHRAEELADEYLESAVNKDAIVQWEYYDTVEA